MHSKVRVFSSNLAKRNVYRKKKKEKRIREIETVEWKITREFHCRRGACPEG